MPAFLVASVVVKDAEKLRHYMDQLPATMEPFGGKRVLRGRVGKVLLGSDRHDIEAIFEFPDVASIEAFWNSDAYQALVELRDEASTADVRILVDL